MKRQWFPTVTVVLIAAAAILLCLMWIARRGVSGPALAAPPDVAPTVPHLTDSPPARANEAALVNAESVDSEAVDWWVTECVDCPKYFRQMTDRSLRLDTAGHPHIAYGGDRLYYAWYDGVNWHLETVDDSPVVGEYASLALDDSGYPHISYLGGIPVSHDLEYAYQDASGWHIQTVGSVGLVGFQTSLALDGSGYPHISYYNGNNHDLKYAYQDASGWHTQTVDSAGVVGWYNSLALDGSGYPHISYYDWANRDLKYATGQKVYRVCLPFIVCNC